MKTQPRRKFLQQTALFTGAATLTGHFIRSIRAGEPGPNEKIRVGLIGSGNMGRGDLECFLDFPDVECVVLADLDKGMTAQGIEVCEKKGRKRPDTTKEFRRVLDRKDVDAVLIATPDHWHALPTVMACQAGKDIYVEKPLAKTIDEGRAMVTAAQKTQPGRAAGVAMDKLPAHAGRSGVRKVRQTGQGATGPRLGKSGLDAEVRQATRRQTAREH